MIADLTAKRQSTLQHLEQLRTERKALALDASLGDEAATKKLRATNAELNRLSLEVDQFDTALSEAASSKRKAQAEADAAAEVARQDYIAVALRQYYDEVQKIDDALNLLASRFTTARQHLDRAQVSMNAQERGPIQQLLSLFAPTLAAAYYGLGEYIALGQPAMHVSHRLPLSQFVLGFVDRWVKPNGSHTAEEPTNGKPTE